MPLSSGATPPVPIAGSASSRTGREDAPAGRTRPGSPARRRRRRLFARSPALADPEVWQSILRQADRVVADDPAAGFTTLLGFFIADGSLAGASSGDSAVLTLSAGDPARDATKGQLKNPPVGSGEARFTFFSAPLTAPWSVLAMSDGVWKYVGWDRLVRAVVSSHGEALVEALRGLARLPRSGRFPDDFTLVVFEETG